MWKDVHRLHANIMLFYTDVRIHEFLYPQWAWNPFLVDTERQLYTRVELLLTTSTGFPGGASGKECASRYVRNSGLTPGFGRSPGVGYGTCSSIFAWTQEPGRLQSMGWQRHKWATEHTTSTATLLIQAAIISYLVFCTNCLADFSASSLMPLCANWRSLMASPLSYGKSLTP